MKCKACNQIIRNSCTQHHIQYNPAKTVPVHKKCHYRIHHTDEYPSLKPVDFAKEPIITLPSTTNREKVCVLKTIGDISFNCVGEKNLKVLQKGCVLLVYSKDTNPEIVKESMDFCYEQIIKK